MLADPPPLHAAELQQGVGLRNAGRFLESRDVLTKVYAARLQRLGPEHYDTVRARGELGRTLRELGELDTACDLHTTNVHACSRVLGRTHPETTNAMHMLADTLEKMGQSAEVAQLRREAAEAGRPKVRLYEGDSKRLENILGLGSLNTWSGGLNFSGAAPAASKPSGLAPTLRLAMSNEDMGLIESRGHLTACKACGKMMHHSISRRDDDLCWIEVGRRRVWLCIGCRNQIHEEEAATPAYRTARQAT